MQNKSARVKMKAEMIKDLYPVKIPKKVPGHVCVGVAPRDESKRVTTIPEKGALGYELLDSGPVKIYAPSETKHVRPMTYYNPQGGKCFTTTRYGGPCWSSRSASRFKDQGCEGPGPAAYSLNNKSTGHKYKDRQISLQDTSPLMRSNDILFRKLCREDLPGPGSYTVSNDNVKKRSFGKRGTFSMAERQPLFQTSQTPGPGDYTVTKQREQSVSVRQVPFAVEADRFPQTGLRNLPGPGDYSPQCGLWADVQKKVHSKYSAGAAPFDSSAVRNLSMTKGDSACIPGPDYYSPQFLSKGLNKGTMSMAERSPKKLNQTSPGPAAYSLMEQFKNVHNQNSHIINHHSAFLSSATRLQEADTSNVAPNTYDIPSTTLANKGFTICGKPKDFKAQMTPGPTDYQPSVLQTLDTHNVTLKPHKERPSRLASICKTKRLRCFLTSKYEHCPITCQ